MNTEIELEKKLMMDLRELSKLEQDSLRVFSAIYVNSYEKIKNEKIDSFEKSIIEQIKFYGRKKEQYQSRINEFINSYNNLITQIIDEYNVRFGSIAIELQDTWNNQKIAITNEKLSINQDNEMKIIATQNKNNNYEIIIQECLKQLENSKIDMENKLNEIFYNKDKSLSVEKINIVQKIINIFVGKNKLENIVFKSLEMELQNQKKLVENEIQKINDKTIKDIAIIKDAQIQTQNMFNNILEGNM